MAETYAEAGANVALVARNLLGCQEAAKEISGKYGIRAIGMAMDVNDSKKVDAVVQAVVSEFGRIDILVNSAGIPGSEKPVLKMTDEDLDGVMNVDFRGTFLASRAVAQVMVKQKSGKIINISSILGKIAARNMVGYCASKAAVIPAHQGDGPGAHAGQHPGERALPGLKPDILTEFNPDFFESEAGKGLVKKMIPLNRVGSLDELKSTALYLGDVPAIPDRDRALHRRGAHDHLTGRRRGGAHVPIALHPSSGIKAAKIGRAEVRKSGQEKKIIPHPLRSSALHNFTS